MSKGRGSRWAIAGALLVLAGCGGGSNSSSRSSAARGQARATSVSADIGNRILTTTEFPGFAPVGAAVRGRDAKGWVVAQQTPLNEAGADTAWLRRHGFVAGAREGLRGGGAEGLSLVERFHTPEAARAELANQARKFRTTVPRSAYSSFTVKGIPGARGFEASGGGDTGINVAFADGAYYYLVGVGWHTGNASPTSRGALIAAATHLYRRVHG